MRAIDFFSDDAHVIYATNDCEAPLMRSILTSFLLACLSSNLCQGSSSSSVTPLYMHEGVTGSGVSAISLSQDETILASGDYRGCVIVWNADIKKKLLTVQCQKTAVVSDVEIISNRIVVAVTALGTVDAWDIEKKKRLWSGNRTGQLASDGDILYASRRKSVARIAPRTGTTIWQTQPWKGSDCLVLMPNGNGVVAVDSKHQFQFDSNGSKKITKTITIPQYMYLSGNLGYLMPQTKRSLTVIPLSLNQDNTPNVPKTPTYKTNGAVIRGCTILPSRDSIAIAESNGIAVMRLSDSKITQRIAPIRPRVIAASDDERTLHIGCTSGHVVKALY